VLSTVQFGEYPMKHSILPMDYFFKQYELKEGRRKSRKVENFIEKYALSLYCSHMNNDDEYFLLKSNFEEMVEDISALYISKEYVGLMSWLINRAFCVTPNTKGRRHITQSTLYKNKSILLKTLYSINPSNLLAIFSKNL
jgi:hypothetical protein